MRRSSLCKPRANPPPTRCRQENYDKSFVDHVYSCKEVSYAELKTRQTDNAGCVRIQYVTKDGFKRTAKMLGLMEDLKVSISSTVPMASFALRVLGVGVL